eukprot:6889255-Prymnesium_polylepis.1
MDELWPTFDKTGSGRLREAAPVAQKPPPVPTLPQARTAGGRASRLACRLRLARRILRARRLGALCAHQQQVARAGRRRAF